MNDSHPEGSVLAQAQEHHRTHGGSGLKILGPCPVCGSSLKYMARHPDFGFIVWCDRVGCLVARGPSAPELPDTTTREGYEAAVRAAGGSLVENPDGTVSVHQPRFGTLGNQLPK
jgi:hypothetical protein